MLPKAHTQALHALAVAAVGQHLPHHLLGKARGADAADHLQLSQTRQQCRVGDQVADPQRAAEGFREAGHVDYPLLAVEGGQAGCRAFLEVCVDIVLDDAQVVLAGQLQQAVGHLGRQAGAGGVLVQAVGEKAARLVRHQQGFEGGQVRAFGGAWHRQHVYLVLAQQVVQVVVAGVFHQYRVTRAQQGAHQQVEAVAGAVGSEDTFGPGGDAQLRQALVQLLAKAGQAQGRAVVEQVLWVAAADLAHCLGQFGGGAPAAG